MGISFRKSLRSNTENDDEIKLPNFNGFYEFLLRELTEDHINQLQVLFSFINLRQLDFKENLVKYLSRGAFKQVYKNELKFFESEEKTPKVVKESFDRHCCSVLLMHGNIMNYIRDPTMLEKIMNQIALSHCFISNAQLNFQMHDLIISEFIKEEFQNSMNMLTHQALNRYMRIIGDRVQQLVEHFTINSRPTDIVTAMKNQREIVENCTKTMEGMNEIYLNTKLEAVSEICLLVPPEDSEIETK